MPSELKRLQNLKAAITKEATAMLDGIGERNMTTDERASLDSLKARLDDTNSRLDVELAQQELERNMAPSRDQPTAPTSGVLGQPLPSFSAPRANGGTPKGRIGARYKDLFPGASLSRGGWNSFEDFLRPIAAGESHPKLLTAMGEGSGSAGGYLVPTEFSAQILDSMIESSVVLSRCRLFPMTGETLKVPGFDASSASGGTLFGGITSAWLGENTAITATTPKLRRIELNARKLAILTAASNELLADGMGFETQLSTALQEASGWFADLAFLRGTGAGQPLGILNDPAKVTVDAEGAQVADTILYTNLVKMFARLHPQCVSNSVWLASTTAIPQLLQLTIVVGVGGAHIPVMTESNGQFSILTRPVVFTEKLPTLGDEGDIVLCDLSQYSVGLRQTVTIERSQHVYFAQDETAWRAISRMDGMGTWKSAYTPYTGSTQSWVVTLATRS